MSLSGPRRTLEFVLDREGGSGMNHYSGMEMAKQRQGGFEREAAVRRQMRATKSPGPDRTPLFSRLLGFRRAARTCVETPPAQRGLGLYRP